MPFARVQFLSTGYCTQLARLAGADKRGLIRFHAVVVLLEHPVHGLSLIDSGYAPAFLEETRRFPQCLHRWLTPATLDPKQNAARILVARGYDPRQVERVFISHFHADHIAGLGCFPSARLIHRAATLQELQRSGTWRQLRAGFLRGLLPQDFARRAVDVAESSFRPGTGALADFKVCDPWGDGDLLLLDLPGHALGHTGFLIRTHARTLCYLVDACWDVNALLRNRTLPWLARRIQHCYPEYERTQRNLRRLAAETGWAMLACHCPRTLQPGTADAH